MYFCVVTRDMVDSCRPSVSAISRSTKRPHRHFAVVEELALTVDDSLRHAQDRVKPLLHVLDQPARFLELAGKPGATLTERIWAYMLLIRKRGKASELTLTVHCPRILRTTTSGVM
jgi:hypothetical protein